MSSTSDMESFVYQDGELVVTGDMRHAYNRDGFLLIKSLWNAKELAVLEVGN